MVFSGLGGGWAVGLSQGELDANIYQHQPFMDAQNKDRGYKLVPVARAVNQQMGVYSKKIKSLADLKSGARVGIPNDPTNGSRALMVLAAQKLIELKTGAGARASVLDITANPKKLRFVELEAAQLARSLDDLDAAAVNSSYAVAAGLSPQKDSLALEATDTPGVTHADRSEEHTSELQSPCNLVCRLLLEKKNRLSRRRHKYRQQLYQYHEKYQPHQKQHQ